MNETTVVIKDKAVRIGGHEMWLKLVEINGVEGWTSGQVQEYLGLVQQTFQQIVRRLRLSGQKLRSTPRRELIAQKIVAINAPTAVFWTKNQIREMAMEAGTERAKEMIRHAFDIVEAVYNGEVKAAQTLAGFTPMEAIRQNRIALDGWEKEYIRAESEKARADHAILTKSHIGNKREATAMATAAKAVLKLRTANKELAKVKQTAGQTGEYRTALAWTKEYTNLPAENLGKRLSALSRELNIATKDTAVISEWGTPLKSYSRQVVLKLLKAHM